MGDDFQENNKTTNSTSLQDLRPFKIVQVLSVDTHPNKYLVLDESGHLWVMWLGEDNVASYHIVRRG